MFAGRALSASRRGPWRITNRVTWIPRLLSSPNRNIYNPARDKSGQDRHLTSQETANDLGDFRGIQDSRFLTKFIEKYKPPPESIEYFLSIPWTRSILEAGTHRLIPFYSRYLEINGESRFWAETVNTKEGVPHVLGLCRNDLWPGEETTGADKSLPEFISLMHLGQTLEAHPGIVNGGFQGVIFDEVMYCVILLHAHKDGLCAQRPKHYTLDLTTRFRAPVNVNTDVLVRANIVSRQDRKWTVEGEIVDSQGKVLTKGESHWLTAKKPIS